MAPLVLGIDSSTQATKALLVDAESGEVLEERRASHPDGTEVDPRAWLAAVDEAAGPLLERAEAVAVGGQQHGMVLLDEKGEVVRDALLWNDTRSAGQGLRPCHWRGPEPLPPADVLRAGDRCARRHRSSVRISRASARPAGPGRVGSAGCRRHPPSHPPDTPTYPRSTRLH